MTTKDLMIAYLQEVERTEKENFFSWLADEFLKTKKAQVDGLKAYLGARKESNVTTLSTLSSETQIKQTSLEEENTNIDTLISEL